MFFVLLLEFVDLRPQCLVDRGLLLWFKGALYLDGPSFFISFLIFPDLWPEDDCEVEEVGLDEVDAFTHIYYKLLISM